MLRSANRVIRSALLLLLAITVATAAQPIRAADGPVKKTQLRKARGRLPAYYASVVTEEQRDQVYKIQQEYNPKIEALEKQLDAVRNERNEKIAAVLTPEQRKQVDEAAATAQAKRANAARRRAEQNQAQPDAAAPADKPKPEK